jgi:hypothetical protein
MGPSLQEHGNQSVKEHITSRIFDDRKSLGPQILNLPRSPFQKDPLQNDPLTWAFGSLVDPVFTYSRYVTDTCRYFAYLSV